MTPSAESKQRKPVHGAGFWRRLAAHALVDFPIITIVLIPVMFALMLRIYGLAGMMKIVESGEQLRTPWWCDLILYTGIFIAMVVLWKTMQATPGKKVFGLKVVDGWTGKPAATWKLSVRSVGYLVASLPLLPVKIEMLGSKEVLPIPLCFGFLWILIDRYHRGWHDLLSGTVTVLATSAVEKATPGEENWLPGRLIDEDEKIPAGTGSETVDR